MDESSSYLILTIVIVILMLPGLIGIVLPAIPGIPYMFVIALIFSLFDRFRHLTILELLFLLILALLSIIVDYMAGLLGARYGGASKRALLYGIIGLIVGTIVLPPLGGILGMFIAIIISELQLRKTHQEAIRAAAGSLLGTVSGIAINLVLAFLFLTLFIFFIR